MFTTTRLDPIKCIVRIDYLKYNLSRSIIEKIYIYIVRHIVDEFGDNFKHIKLYTDLNNYDIIVFYKISDVISTDYFKDTIYCILKDCSTINISDTDYKVDYFIEFSESENIYIYNR